MEQNFRRLRIYITLLICFKYKWKTFSLFEDVFFCVPSMVLILLVKVQSRVFTAKCSEAQVGISNGMGISQRSNNNGKENREKRQNHPTGNGISESRSDGKRIGKSNNHWRAAGRTSTLFELTVHCHIRVQVYNELYKICLCVTIKTHK